MDPNKNQAQCQKTRLPSEKKRQRKYQRLILMGRRPLPKTRGIWGQGGKNSCNVLTNAEKEQPITSKKRTRDQGGEKWTSRTMTDLGEKKGQRRKRKPKTYVTEKGKNE